MAQTRLKSGNLHMVGGDNGSDGNVLKSKGDGTMEWGSAITPPTFSSVDYPGNDTALDPAGGQNLIINGGNFATGATCTIDGTVPSSITINSASQMTVVTPAKSAGSYALVISNTDGGSATSANAVSYNGIPAFTHAAGSLGTVNEGTTVNLSVVATEPDGGAITHTITSGSLPSGLSLNASTGAITGTAPDVSANTTSNFSITATDNENQSTVRAYSITVNNVNVADHFNIVLYTGDGNSGKAVTGVGFKPDFVWLKERNKVENHNLYDSSRGVQKFLASNSTNAEATGAQRLQSFDNDGFTLGSDNECNDSGVPYVAWCWKANGGTTNTNNDGSITSTVQANDTLGFSIVQFTGSGSNATVGHGLSSAPDYIIMTNRTRQGYGWYVYNSASGPTKNMVLNTADAESTNASAWNNTATTATTFSLGTETGTNSNNYPYIAYCFTNKTGFSKAGSYTGNGSDNGPVVDLGFSPAFLMIKTTGSDSWFMVDNKRETANPRGDRLFANSTVAEATESGAQVDFFTTGFKIRGSGSGQGQVNSNGTTYIYLAFAASLPSTTPTLADSFNAITYTGNSSTNNITGLGFQPDLVWTKVRTGSNSWHFLADSTRGGTKVISSNSSNAEQTRSNHIQSFNSDGFTLGADGSSNYNNETYVSWNWKAGGIVPTYNTTGSINSMVSANSNAGFSIVKYTGGGGVATIGHGLSSAPEMVIVKSLGHSANWYTYHVGLDASSPEDYNVRIDQTDGRQDSASYWNDTAPTNSVFTIGTTTGVSQSGTEFIAYCFHSVTGYSKFGSYDGTGTSSRSFTGLGFQPDLIVIKCTSANSTRWHVYDSTRGVKKRLLWNDDGQEYNEASSGSAGLNSFDSDGWTIGNDGDLNGSGRTFMYMAFKIN